MHARFSRENFTVVSKLQTRPISHALLDTHLNLDRSFSSVITQQGSSELRFGATNLKSALAAPAGLHCFTYSVIVFLTLRQSDLIHRVSYLSFWL